MCRAVGEIGATPAHKGFISPEDQRSRSFGLAQKRVGSATAAKRRLTSGWRVEGKERMKTSRQTWRGVRGQSKPATHTGQLYCIWQGLGQHIGLGMPSARAKMGAAPEASSKNVTKIILTIVFFMFSLLSLSGFDFLSAKHSR
jgi:hypothetical protein